MNAKGSSDLLGDNDSSQIVHSANYAGCFHISFSFYDTFGGRPQVAPTDSTEHFRRGELRSPAYNNFTNYAVSICKRQEIIPQDLLFEITML